MTGLFGGAFDPPHNGHVALAEIALESGETVSVLRPLYLRPPDARPQATAVARR